MRHARSHEVESWLEEAAVGCALLGNHINRIKINQEIDIAGSSSGSKEQQQRPDMKYTTNFIQDKYYNSLLTGQ